MSASPPDPSSAPSAGPFPRDIRRIVTGHAPDGRAVALSDGPSPRVIRPEGQPGLAFHEIWSSAAIPAPLGFAEAEPTAGHAGTAPPPGGAVVRIVDIPPEGPEMAAGDAGQVLAAVGLANHAAPGRHPLMHRTESVDYGVVLAGEITLVLDEGECALKPGDVVVQRGTIHAWANRSAARCRMLFVLTDATFAPELEAAQAAQDARVAAGVDAGVAAAQDEAHDAAQDGAQDVAQDGAP